MNNTVLITGGAGYIGSHTCKRFKQAGFLPVAYDNLIYGHRDLVRWGPFCEGDILDGQRLDEVFHRFQPHAVIHFAAFAYVGESVCKPRNYYHNNVIGTMSLLDAMSRNGCNKIVFSSTCAVFGVSETTPITETIAKHPINPYGRSKLMIEQILADYQRAYGIQYISLRYFNAAGADPDGETGEDHTPETHLIPLVLDAAIGRRENIEIFGTDYKTTDGTAIRDYIHVADLADAHLKGLEYMNSYENSDHFNLGRGVGASVKEVIESAREVTGKHIPTVVGQRRAGDPPVLVADAGKASRILDWQPRYSSLQAIMETAWNWHKSRHSGTS
jgi:UDP-arabinose 4-epimerase